MSKDTKASFNGVIRKISTKQELLESPAVINLLNSIVSESESDLNHSLKDSRLKNFTGRSEAWKVSEEWLDSFEATNKSILVAEIEGVPKAALVYMVNDLETRANVGIAANRNFVIMIKAITGADVRDTGIISQLTDTMYQDTRDLEAIYISCMTNKLIVDNTTGKESFMVANLDRYAFMHRKNFLDNQLQIRYRDVGGHQFGREKVNLDLVVNKNHEIDNNKVNAFINGHISRAKLENKEVMGFYIQGDVRKKWVSRIEEKRESRSQSVAQSHL